MMWKIVSNNAQVNQEELKGLEESFAVSMALIFMLEGH